ncbi:Pycsar system effector family protein [Spirillospora sp. NPDC048824]|uniref:Pycsar system effector family protein n=1 Tax=Spirillospora sp. NPDC048824 TaxID=3364526 RepID=UPI003716F4B0
MSADHAWRTLAEVNGWIRLADTKAAALLSLSGLLGGWMLLTIPAGRAPALRTVTLMIGLTLTVATACLALNALRPSTRHTALPSTLHFGDIARGYARAATAFADECSDLFADEERLTRALCDQVWVNSIIAARKFRDVDRALLMLTAAMTATAAALLMGG